MVSWNAFYHLNNIGFLNAGNCMSTFIFCKFESALNIVKFVHNPQAGVHDFSIHIEIWPLKRRDDYQTCRT